MTEEQVQELYPRWQACQVSSTTYQSVTVFLGILVIIIVYDTNRDL